MGGQLCATVQMARLIPLFFILPSLGFKHNVKTTTKTVDCETVLPVQDLTNQAFSFGTKGEGKFTQLQRLKYCKQVILNIHKPLVKLHFLFFFRKASSDNFNITSWSKSVTAIKYLAI